MKIIILFIFLITLILLTTVSINYFLKPKHIGLHNEKLNECPHTPNCVYSQSTDEHFIKPLDANIEQIKKALELLPRVKIVEEKENYFYVTFTTKIMRYTDDVEFLYDPITKITHVRSASRIGHSDLGKNRERIEHIRKRLLL
jgi:uncharacterized protein (DUF1499 family)